MKTQQEKKLKIYFEDESVKVVQNVENFTICLKTNNKIMMVKYRARVKGLKFTGGGLNDQTPSKEYGEIGGDFSFDDNQIVKVDFEGETIYQIKR